MQVMNIMACIAAYPPQLSTNIHYFYYRPSSSSSSSSRSLRIVLLLLPSSTYHGTYQHTVSVWTRTISVQYWILTIKRIYLTFISVCPVNFGYLVSSDKLFFNNILILISFFGSWIVFHVVPYQYLIFQPLDDVETVTDLIS